MSEKVGSNIERFCISNDVICNRVVKIQCNFIQTRSRSMSDPTQGVREIFLNFLFRKFMSYLIEFDLLIPNWYMKKSKNPPSGRIPTISDIDFKIKWLWSELTLTPMYTKNIERLLYISVSQRDGFQRYPFSSNIGGILKI